MKLSVIIPTYKRLGSVKRTLMALCCQTMDKSDYEVIVIDDGSPRGYSRELKELKPVFNYRFQQKAHGGLAKTRNYGANLAQGEVLYFLDDDVVPGEDTLRQHWLLHARSSQPRAVIGTLSLPPDLKLDTFHWYLYRCGHFDPYQNLSRYPHGRPPIYLMHGNSSVNIKAFYRVGKYDESFNTYGGRDMDLGYRLEKSGVEMIHNPEAIGYCYQRNTFQQFCLDSEIAGEGLIRIYRKYPEIKELKKIAWTEDPYGQLAAHDKLMKLILSLSLSFPFTLALPRALIAACGTQYHCRSLLYPFYYWISQYHIAVGMKRGLASAKPVLSEVPKA